MITVFTTPQCGYCHMTKVYLSSRKIRYDEKDITKDPVAAHWVERAVGQIATPVIQIDDEIILGFDRNHIDLVLKQKAII